MNPASSRKNHRTLKERMVHNRISSSRVQLHPAQARNLFRQRQRRSERCIENLNLSPYLISNSFARANDPQPWRKPLQTFEPELLITNPNKNGPHRTAHEFPLSLTIMVR